MAYSMHFYRRMSSCGIAVAKKGNGDMKKTNIIKATDFEKRLRRNEKKKLNKQKYEGSYVYYIIYKPLNLVVYVGSTGNILTRFEAHFSTPSNMKSCFNRFCIENELTEEDKANYEMIVLDITDVEELDYDDRLLIERMLQYYHKETIINKRIPSKLEAYEIERFEYICSLVEFDFKPYREVKTLKMNNKKSHEVCRPHDLM